MMTRRRFLGSTASGLMPLEFRALGQQPSAGSESKRMRGGTAGDTLARDFSQVAGVGPLDNNPVIIGIEKRLHCTCGCTLDVYTCRTTDFSCTFSPAMHHDVVTQYQAGATPDQIIQAFVTKNGPSVLMAPPARGFSMAGYLAPGLSIGAAVLVLLAWLLRRKQQLATVASLPVAVHQPTTDELERLRRALDDVES